jgi:hypothetical protein
MRAPVKFACRAVGAFSAGTIVDPVTAESQLMGGLIRGQGDRERPSGRPLH